MTQMNLSFVIDAARATMRLSGIRAPVVTSGNLAANVAYVNFDTVSGGNILYNDRPQIPETFSDPSPYQALLNQWIAAMSSSTPALTLAQSQAIKCSLVDAISSVKRQAPISVATSIGTKNWDASDLAVSRVLGPLSGFMFVDPVNAALSKFTSDLASWATNFNNFESSVQSAFASIASQINTEINNAIASDVAAGGGTISSNFAPMSAAASVTTSTDAALSESISTFAIQMIPYGDTAAVTITASDIKAIVMAIVARNIAIQVTTSTKKAAINSLTSVASVALYDATSGW